MKIYWTPTSDYCFGLDLSQLLPLSVSSPAKILRSSRQCVRPRCYQMFAFFAMAHQCLFELHAKGKDTTTSL